MPVHIRSPVRAMPGDPPPSAEPRPAAVTLIAALLGAALILLCEALTPLALSMGCLYMLLAAYAATRLGNTAIVGLLTATSTGGMLVHHLQLAGNGPVGVGFSGAEIWNGATRLVTICLFGLVLRRLLMSLRRERSRAQRDPLTGALNRRALYERYDALAAHPGWRTGVCGVVFLDLDAFKPANDQFGHAAGDALLARFVFAATGALGEPDHFARIGGDEFVALIVGGDEETVEQRVYALHARLALMLQETGLGVTCSGGAVIAPIGGGQKLDGLIKRADRLMYEVKDGGKDGMRIVCRASTDVAIDPAYRGRARVRAEERRNTA